MPQSDNVEQPDAPAGEAQALVSVVTVFYNRGRHVAASVRSLLDQSYPRLEIIVVDDGSTDDTLEQLRQFAGDPRVVIIQKANSGFTNSMRDAIARARGSLIAVHGSGDISHPHRIARQVEALAARPDVGIVGCHVINPVVGQNRVKRVGRPNGLDFRAELLRGNMFTHGEVMYRKALYDAAGGYRPFFVLGQDLDLWLRMSRLTGYWIVEEVLYTRAEIAGGVSTSPDKVIRQQRLTELARQCAEEVDAGRADLIELHGAHALDRMRKTKRLANRLALNGLRTMVSGGDAAKGWPLVAAAFSERRTPRTVASYVLLATYRLPLLFNGIVKPILLAAGRARTPSTIE